MRGDEARARDMGPGRGVEYRALPGWPRHRAGSDHSVWALRPRHGQQPYGWRLGPDSRSWIPEPRERAVLALMRRLEADGVSQGRIADELNGRGIPGKLGGRWRKCQVCRCLRRRDAPPPAVTVRWERLPVAVRRGVPTVVLWDEGRRRYRRPAGLLFRWAFRPLELTPAERRRLGLEAPAPAATRAEACACPPPAPAPLDDRVVAVEAPAAWPEALPDDDEDIPGYARGSRHGAAKMTEPDVVEARRLHREGMGYAALCDRFKVGRVALHYMLSGKTWKHVPMES